MSRSSPPRVSQAPPSMGPPDSLRLPSINPSSRQDVPRLPNIRELLSSTSAPTSPPSDPSSPPGRSSSSSPRGGGRLPSFPSPTNFDFLPPKSATSSQYARPFEKNKRQRLGNSESPPRVDRSERPGPYDRARVEERNADPPGPRWQTPDPDPPVKPAFQYSTRPIVPIRIAAPPVVGNAVNPQPTSRSPTGPGRTKTIGGSPPKRTP